MGFESTFTDNKNEMEWIEFLWEESKNIAKDFKINLPDFKKFWANGFMRFPVQIKRKLC